jgi:uncharacterized protein YutE (UPF0331/DUF86 family)
MTAITPLPETPTPTIVFRVPPPARELVDFYELELFPYYLRESEEQLTSILATEQAYIDEQLKAGAEEELNDSGMVAADYFTKRVRRSHIIYLASLLQTSMVKACQSLARLKQIDKWEAKAAEHKGDQWGKKRKFLDEHGGIQIPEATWKVLAALVVLRNNLVHSNGELDVLSDKHRELLSTLPGVKFGEYELQVESVVVEHCFGATRRAVNIMEESLLQLYLQQRGPTT